MEIRETPASKLWMSYSQIHDNILRVMIIEEETETLIRGRAGKRLFHEYIIGNILMLLFLATFAILALRGHYAFWVFAFLFLVLALWQNAVWTEPAFLCEYFVEFQRLDAGKVIATLSHRSRIGKPTTSKSIEVHTCWFTERNHGVRFLVVQDERGKKTKVLVDISGTYRGRKRGQPGWQAFERIENWLRKNAASVSAAADAP